MPNDPKLKFILEVDDEGKIKFTKFGKEIDQTAAKGGTFGMKMKVVGKSVAGLAVDMGKAIAKAALLGAGLVAVGAAFVAKRSIGEFKEFEVSLARLGNVTTTSLEEIKKKLFSIDAALGNATELVKGYYQVLSAGVIDPVKSLELLTEASRVAKVQSLEQGEVVKGIAALMGAYAGELDTASAAADKLFTIERLGITTVGELIPHIGSLGNLAAATGLSVDEMAASLAQVTAAGQGTSESVTQLQSLLRSLLKPTKVLEAAFVDYGGVQTAIKKIGFENVLKLVEKASGGTASGLLKLLGRAEAVLAMLQLSKTGFADLNTKLGEVKESTGASADAWGRYEKTLESIWNTFKNVVTNQAILIGEKLAPKIKEVTNLVGDWLTVNRGLITQKIGDFIGRIVIFTDKLEINIRAKLIPAIKEFVSIVRTEWIPAITAFATKINTELINPIISVIDKAGKARNAIKGFISLIPAIAQTKAIVEFLGVGSTVKPLGEKIDEMTTRIGGFSTEVDSLLPVLTVGFDDSAVRAGLSKMTDTLFNVGMRPSINVSDRPFVDVAARGQSFAEGTGPKGLPQTGLFFGHEKEIVLNPRESALVRSNVASAGGASPSLGGPTINATLNVTYLTGDRASMESAGDALMDIISRKSKRLS